jgi:hypothetical protein
MTGDTEGSQCLRFKIHVLFLGYLQKVVEDPTAGITIRDTERRVRQGRLRQGQRDDQSLLSFLSDDPYFD